WRGGMGDVERRVGGEEVLERAVEGEAGDGPGHAEEAGEHEEAAGPDRGGRHGNANEPHAEMYDVGVRVHGEAEEGYPGHVAVVGEAGAKETHDPEDEVGGAQDAGEPHHDRRVPVGHGSQGGEPDHGGRPSAHPSPPASYM